MLTSGETEFILEAHNGLSARIVEEAGFKGIWGSGLALSAQHAVRDNNELSWTQVIDQLEFMTDVTSIPILLDGDTGYGDFNNMRRLVRKLGQIGVAGVCIEDKLFPKTNSFIQGEAQPLEDIQTFCGKIQAGKDSQTDDDFSIVARVEAFIAGIPVLRRQVDKFKKQGINNITVVAGYRHDAIDVQGADVVVNEDWETTGELASLKFALDSFTQDTVIIYGDVLFRSYMLHNLLDWDADLLVVVDSSASGEATGNSNDLAWCSAPDNRAMCQQEVTLRQVGKESEFQGQQADGRWIGIMKVAGEGVQLLRSAMDTLQGRDDFSRLGIPDLLNQLIADGHAPQVQYVNGHWMDINNLSDLERAATFEKSHND